MGDADSTAALKRRVAAMEAALSALTAELSTAQDRIAAVEGGGDGALAAAVREQTAAIRAAAATANAEAKPDVPPEFAAAPMCMAPACHAAALALQAGPAVAAGRAYAAAGRR